MRDYLAGAISITFLIVVMYFLRAWRKTDERLFLMFACAFWLMSLERVVFTLVRMRGEEEWVVYTMRLLAFGIIAIAIVQKNLSPESPPEA